MNCSGGTKNKSIVKLPKARQRSAKKQGRLVQHEEVDDAASTVGIVDRNSEESNVKEGNRSQESGSNKVIQR